MTERTETEAFLAKAERSLAGAESELASGRYDNCANRAYYACFQAAIAALIRVGVRPRGERGRWNHDFVQAAFAEQLVRRRKRYANEVHSNLLLNQSTRKPINSKSGRLRGGAGERNRRRARGATSAGVRGRGACGRRTAMMEEFELAPMAPLDDPRVDEALAEMRATIQSHYPEATFTIFEGFDPPGMYLRAAVAQDDTDEVVELILHRMIHFLNEERLPVYVIAVRPRERVAATRSGTAPSAKPALP